MALKMSFARVLVAGAFVSVAALVAVPGVSQAKTKAPPKYYLSLGDSYSVGYQPVPSGATSGYTAIVAKKLKMTLENYGCGGATTESILSFTGVCGAPNTYGPPAATDRGTIPSGESQVTAADNFITAHPGQIGLVTVSIGGNDVTSCATAPNAITCVAGVVTSIQSNVTSLVNQLESHLGAGNTTPIIGLTYPDVILGDYVTTPPNVSLANLSTTAFSALINPALEGRLHDGLLAQQVRRPDDHGAVHAEAHPGQEVRQGRHRPGGRDRGVQADLVLQHPSTDEHPRQHEGLQDRGQAHRVDVQGVAGVPADPVVPTAWARRGRRSSPVGPLRRRPFW